MNNLQTVKNFIMGQSYDEFTTNNIKVTNNVTITQNAANKISFQVAGPDPRYAQGYHFNTSEFAIWKFRIKRTPPEYLDNEPMLSVVMQHGLSLGQSVTVISKNDILRVNNGHPDKTFYIGCKFLGKQYILIGEMGNVLFGNTIIAGNYPQFFEVFQFRFPKNAVIGDRITYEFDFMGLKQFNSYPPNLPDIDLLTMQKNKLYLQNNMVYGVKSAKDH